MEPSGYEILSKALHEKLPLMELTIVFTHTQPENGAYQVCEYVALLSVSHSMHHYTFWHNGRLTDTIEN